MRLKKRRMVIPSSLKMGMSFNGRQIKWSRSTRTFISWGMWSQIQMAMGACLTTSLRLPSDLLRELRWRLKTCGLKLVGIILPCSYGIAQISPVNRSILKSPLRQIVNFLSIWIRIRKWHWMESGWRFRKNTKVPSVCPLRNCLFAIQRSFLRLICQKDLNWP